MLQRSSNGLRVRYLDGEAVKRELTVAAKGLMAADATVAAVFVFGSLAKGNYTPSSDADILVVLRGTDERRPMDRIPDYLPWFAGGTLPVDVVVLTEDELLRMRADGNLFAREVLGSGTLLAGSLPAHRLEE